MPARTVPTFLLFFATAAATRLALQHTLDTRYQIVMFWMLAVALEAVMRTSKGDFRTGRLLSNGLAATLAMIAVRIILEGVPAKVAHWI